MKNIVFLCLFFTACSNADQFEFRAVKEFNMNKEALSDGEEVEVEYVSGGPENEKKYYYHYLVRSMETGKKINVLSRHLTEGVEPGTKTNFIADSEVMTLIEQNFKKINRDKEVDFRKLEATSPGIERVAVNTKYELSKPNNYPTVIGKLGSIER